MTTPSPTEGDAPKGNTNLPASNDADTSTHQTRPGTVPSQGTQHSALSPIDPPAAAYSDAAIPPNSPTYADAVSGTENPAESRTVTPAESKTTTPSTPDITTHDPHHNPAPAPHQNAAQTTFADVMAQQTKSRTARPGVQQPTSSRKKRSSSPQKSGSSIPAVQRAVSSFDTPSRSPSPNPDRSRRRRKQRRKRKRRHDDDSDAMDTEGPLSTIESTRSRETRRPGQKSSDQESGHQHSAPVHRTRGSPPPVHRTRGSPPPSLQRKAPRISMSAVPHHPTPNTPKSPRNDSQSIPPVTSLTDTSTQNRISQNRNTHQAHYNDTHYVDFGDYCVQNGWPAARKINRDDNINDIPAKYKDDDVFRVVMTGNNSSSCTRAESIKCKLLCHETLRWIHDVLRDVLSFLPDTDEGCDARLKMLNTRNIFQEHPIPAQEPWSLCHIRSLVLDRAGRGSRNCALHLYTRKPETYCAFCRGPAHHLNEHDAMPQMLCIHQQDAQQRLRASAGDVTEKHPRCLLCLSTDHTKFECPIYIKWYKGTKTSRFRPNIHYDKSTKSTPTSKSSQPHSTDPDTSRRTKDSRTRPPIHHSAPAPTSNARHTTSTKQHSGTHQMSIDGSTPSNSALDDDASTMPDMKRRELSDSTDELEAQSVATAMRNSRRYSRMSWKELNHKLDTADRSIPADAAKNEYHQLRILRGELQAEQNYRLEHPEEMHPEDDTQSTIPSIPPTTPGGPSRRHKSTKRKPAPQHRHHPPLHTDSRNVVSPHIVNSPHHRPQSKSMNRDGMRFGSALDDQHQQYHSDNDRAHSTVSTIPPHNALKHCPRGDTFDIPYDFLESIGLGHAYPRFTPFETNVPLDRPIILSDIPIIDRSGKHRILRNVHVCHQPHHRRGQWAYDVLKGLPGYQSKPNPAQHFGTNTTAFTDRDHNKYNFWAERKDGTEVISLTRRDPNGQHVTRRIQYPLRALRGSSIQDCDVLVAGLYPFEDPGDATTGADAVGNVVRSVPDIHGHKHPGKYCQRCGHVDHPTSSCSQADNLDAIHYGRPGMASPLRPPIMPPAIRTCLVAGGMKVDETSPLDLLKHPQPFWCTLGRHTLNDDTSQYIIEVQAKDIKRRTARRNRRGDKPFDVNSCIKRNNALELLAKCYPHLKDDHKHCCSVAAGFIVYGHRYLPAQRIYLRVTILSIDQQIRKNLLDTRNMMHFIKQLRAMTDTSSFVWRMIERCFVASATSASYNVKFFGGHKVNIPRRDKQNRRNSPIEQLDIYIDLIKAIKFTMDPDRSGNNLYSKLHWPPQGHTGTKPDRAAAPTDTIILNFYAALYYLWARHKDYRRHIHSVCGGTDEAPAQITLMDQHHNSWHVFLMRLPPLSRSEVLNYDRKQDTPVVYVAGILSTYFCLHPSRIIVRRKWTPNGDQYRNNTAEALLPKAAFYHDCALIQNTDDDGILRLEIGDMAVLHLYPSDTTIPEETWPIFLEHPHSLSNATQVIRNDRVELAEVESDVDDTATTRHRRHRYGVNLGDAYRRPIRHPTYSAYLGQGSQREQRTEDNQSSGDGTLHSWGGLNYEIDRIKDHELLNDQSSKRSHSTEVKDEDTDSQSSKSYTDRQSTNLSSSHSHHSALAFEHRHNRYTTHPAITMGNSKERYEYFIQTNGFFPRFKDCPFDETQFIDPKDEITIRQEWALFRWLRKGGYPDRQLYHLAHYQTKVEVFQIMGTRHYVHTLRTDEIEEEMKSVSMGKHDITEILLQTQRYYNVRQRGLRNRRRKPTRVFLCHIPDCRDATEDGKPKGLCSGHLANFKEATLPTPRHLTDEHIPEFLTNEGAPLQLLSHFSDITTLNRTDDAIAESMYERYWVAHDRLITILRDRCPKTRDRPNKNKDNDKNDPAHPPGNPPPPGNQPPDQPPDQPPQKDDGKDPDLDEDDDIAMGKNDGNGNQHASTHNNLPLVVLDQELDRDGIIDTTSSTITQPLLPQKRPRPRSPPKEDVLIVEQITDDEDHSPINTPPISPVMLRMQSPSKKRKTLSPTPRNNTLPPSPTTLLTAAALQKDTPDTAQGTIKEIGRIPKRKIRCYRPSTIPKQRIELPLMTTDNRYITVIPNSKSIILPSGRLQQLRKERQAGTPTTGKIELYLPGFQDFYTSTAQQWGDIDSNLRLDSVWQAIERDIHDQAQRMLQKYHDCGEHGKWQPLPERLQLANTINYKQSEYLRSLHRDTSTDISADDLLLNAKHDTIDTTITYLHRCRHIYFFLISALAEFAGGDIADDTLAEVLQNNRPGLPTSETDHLSIPRSPQYSRLLRECSMMMALDLQRLYTNTWPHTGPLPPVLYKWMELAQQHKITNVPMKDLYTITSTKTSIRSTRLRTRSPRDSTSKKRRYEDISYGPLWQPPPSLTLIPESTKTVPPENPVKKRKISKGTDQDTVPTTEETSDSDISLIDKTTMERSSLDPPSTEPQNQGDAQMSQQQSLRRAVLNDIDNAHPSLSATPPILTLLAHNNQDTSLQKITPQQLLDDMDMNPTLAKSEVMIDILSGMTDDLRSNPPPITMDLNAPTLSRHTPIATDTPPSAVPTNAASSSTISKMSAADTNDTASTNMNEDTTMTSLDTPTTSTTMTRPANSISNEPTITATTSPSTTNITLNAQELPLNTPLPAATTVPQTTSLSNTSTTTDTATDNTSPTDTISLVTTKPTTGPNSLSHTNDVNPINMDEDTSSVLQHTSMTHKEQADPTSTTSTITDTIIPMINGSSDNTILSSNSPMNSAPLPPSVTNLDLNDDDDHKAPPTESTTNDQKDTPSMTLSRQEMLMAADILARAPDSYLSLDIHPPWCFLAVTGAKKIENRNWSFSSARDGRIVAIHVPVTKQGTKKHRQELYSRPDVRKYLKQHPRTAQIYRNTTKLDRFFEGLRDQIIGVVRLNGCHSKKDKPLDSEMYPFADVPTKTKHHWILTDPICFHTPVHNYKGHQNLLEMDPSKHRSIIDHIFRRIYNHQKFLKTTFRLIPGGCRSPNDKHLRRQDDDDEDDDIDPSHHATSTTQSTLSSNLTTSPQDAHQQHSNTTSTSKAPVTSKAMTIDTLMNAVPLQLTPQWLRIFHKHSKTRRIEQCLYGKITIEWGSDSDLMDSDTQSDNDDSDIDSLTQTLSPSHSADSINAADGKEADSWDQVITPCPLSLHPTPLRLNKETSWTSVTTTESLVSTIAITPSPPRSPTTQPPPLNLQERVQQRLRYCERLPRARSIEYTTAAGTQVSTCSYYRKTPPPMLNWTSTQPLPLREYEERTRYTHLPHHCTLYIDNTIISADHMTIASTLCTDTTEQPWFVKYQPLSLHPLEGHCCFGYIYPDIKCRRSTGNRAGTFCAEHFSKFHLHPYQSPVDVHLYPQPLKALYGKPNLLDTEWTRWPSAAPEQKNNDQHSPHIPNDDDYLTQQQVPSTKTLLFDDLPHHREAALYDTTRGTTISPKHITSILTYCDDTMEDLAWFLHDQRLSTAPNEGFVCYAYIHEADKCSLSVGRDYGTFCPYHHNIYRKHPRDLQIDPYEHLNVEAPQLFRCYRLSYYQTTWKWDGLDNDHVTTWPSKSSLTAPFEDDQTIPAAEPESPLPSREPHGDADCNRPLSLTSTQSPLQSPPHSPPQSPCSTPIHRSPSGPSPMAVDSLSPPMEPLALRVYVPSRPDDDNGNAHTIYQQRLQEINRSPSFRFNTLPHHYAPISVCNKTIPINRILPCIPLLGNNYQSTTTTYWQKYVYISSDPDEGFICMAHIHVDEFCLRSVGPHAGYFCADHQLIYEAQAITHHHYTHNPYLNSITVTLHPINKKGITVITDTTFLNTALIPTHPHDIPLHPRPTPQQLQTFGLRQEEAMREDPYFDTMLSPQPAPTESDLDSDDPEQQSPRRETHSPSPYTRHLLSFLPNGDDDTGPTPPCPSQEFTPPDTPSFAPSTSPDSPQHAEVRLETPSIRQDTDPKTPPTDIEDGDFDESQYVVYQLNADGSYRYLGESPQRLQEPPRESRDPPADGSEPVQLLLGEANDCKLQAKQQREGMRPISLNDSQQLGSTSPPQARSWLSSNEVDTNSNVHHSNISPRNPPSPSPSNPHPWLSPSSHALTPPVSTTEPPSPTTQSRPKSPWNPGGPSPSPYLQFLHSLLPKDSPSPQAPTPPPGTPELTPPDDRQKSRNQHYQNPHYRTLDAVGIPQGSALRPWKLLEYQDDIAYLPPSSMENTPEPKDCGIHCLCPPGRHPISFHRSICPINNAHTTPNQHTRNTHNDPHWAWCVPSIPSPTSSPKTLSPDPSLD